MSDPTVSPVGCVRMSATDPPHLGRSIVRTHPQGACLFSRPALELVHARDPTETARFLT